MKTPSAKSSDAPAVSFEHALQELESIVRALENGGTPLEASLKSYERGVTLLKYCQQTLTQAEQKIRVLDGDDLQDFSPPEASNT